MSGTQTEWDSEIFTKNCQRGEEAEQEIAAVNAEIERKGLTPGPIGNMKTREEHMEHMLDLINDELDLVKEDIKRRFQLLMSLKTEEDRLDGNMVQVYSGDEFIYLKGGMAIHISREDGRWQWVDDAADGAPDGGGFHGWQWVHLCKTINDVRKLIDEEVAEL